MVPHLSVKAIVAALRSLLAGYPWGGGGGTLPSARNGIIHARAPSLASVRGIRSDPGAGIVHARSGFTASLLGVAEVRHVGIIYATPGFSATVRGTAEKPGAAVFYALHGSSATVLGKAARTGKVTGRLGTRGSVFGTKVDAVPSAPVLAGTAANGRHDLNWNIPNGNGAPVTSYILYRDLFTGSNSRIYNLGNVTSYTDFTVQNGTEYSWIVVAYNQYTNHSGGSNNVFLIFTAQVPSTPVLSGTAGDTFTDLTWPTPSSPGSPLQAYTLTRNGQVVSPAPAANSNSYHDIGRTNGTRYDYVLTANNAGGASAPSNTVPLTPQGAVSSVVDIPNGDGAFRMLAFGNTNMTFVDYTTWSQRGFGGYITHVGIVQDNIQHYRASTVTNNNLSQYNVQRDVENNFKPGDVGSEGYFKTYIRQTGGTNKPNPPFPWFNTTERTNWKTRWNEVGAFQQWFGHGLKGGAADTEVAYWGLNYDAGGGVRDSHTDAQIIAQIRSWGYAHGQGLLSSMPNAIMVVYNWNPSGGYSHDVVYNPDMTLDGRGYYTVGGTNVNTNWYGDEAMGPKETYWLGYLDAMADFGGSGCKLVNINAFFYKPPGNGFMDGQYKHETQGAIAKFSTNFTPAQWAKLYNKIDFSFFSWMGTDVDTFYHVTGEPEFTNQLAKMRQYGMGSRRGEYTYSGEPSRECWLDAQPGSAHHAKEQPPGVSPGGGFYFQENNFYTHQTGDLPRYSFSDYGMNFPAFGNPPGTGRLAGMIAAANRSTPFNTTKPTLRDTNGNLNTVTKTNLGNGTFRIAGRVSHPNGCRGAACWNITTDPSRQSPKVDVLIWNKNGGTDSGGYPNDYLQFSIVVPGTPGNHVIVQGISVHDQTRNLEIVL